MGGGQNRRCAARFPPPAMSTVRKSAARCLMIANVLAALNVSAWPQAMEAGQGSDIGRAEYLANCAECHGADAKGTGPQSATLKTRPADLTALAKNNKGVFAPDAVYRAIDGRGAVRTHHSMDMPIWGCRHPSPYLTLRKGHRRRHQTPPAVRKKVQEPTAESLLDLPCDPESITRDRIQSVVDYLSRIQEK
jgi:mono/diheme cytochrome c family protein